MFDELDYLNFISFIIDTLRYKFVKLILLLGILDFM